MPAGYVARRLPKARNGMDCRICRLPEEAMQAVNVAIWEGSTTRTRNYRDRARELFELITGEKIGVTSVGRHAAHVEKSWRIPSVEDPARYMEVPVFPSDYESLIEAAAVLGAKAMAKLTASVDRGELTATELLSAAKVGVTARTQQESNRIASRAPRIELTAIFGLASGHLAQLPESEALDVTPEKELLDEVRAERLLLEAHSRA